MRRRRIICLSVNIRFISQSDFITDEDMKVDNIRISFQIVCSQNNQHDYRHNHYHHLEDIFPRTRLRRTSDERKRETARRVESEGGGSQVQFRANVGTHVE